MSRSGTTIQIPSNVGVYCPNPLVPRMHEVIAEGIRRFPRRSQAFKLCKYVIAEMTAQASAAVDARTVKAHAVLADSGIRGVIRLILEQNYSDPDEVSWLEGKILRTDE